MSDLFETVGGFLIEYLLRFWITRLIYGALCLLVAWSFFESHSAGRAYRHEHHTSKVNLIHLIAGDWGLIVVFVLVGLIWLCLGLSSVWCRIVHGYYPPD